MGFPITEAKARAVLNAGLDPAWLTGPASFPAAMAAYVNGCYFDKTPNERLKLFLSSLMWEDKQGEYRDFLERQKAQAENNRQKAETEADRQRKEAKHRTTPRPAICGNCGAVMPADGELCPVCDHYVVWDDEQEKYIFQRRLDLSEFAKALGKKHRISNDDMGDVSQYFTEI